VAESSSNYDEATDTMTDIRMGMWRFNPMAHWIPRLASGGVSSTQSSLGHGPTPVGPRPVVAF